MEFYRVLDMLPVRWRPHFITLALTGLSSEKLCEIQPHQLDHGRRAISVQDSDPSPGQSLIYVAEEFWPYVLASVPAPVTHSYLRDHWNAAVDRAGLRKLSVNALRPFRAKLLAEAEAEVECRVLGVLLSDSAEEPSKETVQDRRKQEEARLLAQLHPVLALTEDEGRRLLLRKVD